MLFQKYENDYCQSDVTPTLMQWDVHWDVTTFFFVTFTDYSYSYWNVLINLLEAFGLVEIQNRFLVYQMNWTGSGESKH